MPIRETGSIVVPAPRARVYELLSRRFEREAGVLAIPSQRISTSRETFVLRDAPGGTRVVLARTGAGFAFLPKPREDLRLAVESELFHIQKLVETIPGDSG